MAVIISTSNCIIEVNLENFSEKWNGCIVIDIASITLRESCQNSLSILEMRE